MFAHDVHSKSIRKSNMTPAAPKRRSECIQLFAPRGLTAGFANKHMFRPLAAHSLTYSDETEITDSTLVKLPEGERDLKDLYEAATPGVNIPGDVDFQVPTIEYNGAAITNTTATVDRYLQFTTDTSGRICHLENAATNPAANSYANLRPLLAGIRTTRKAAMDKAYKDSMSQSSERMAILTVNDWIEKVVGEKMDPVTLEHHEEYAKCIHEFLKFVLDLDQYLNDFLIGTQKHVDGHFLTPDIKKILKPAKSMADSIKTYSSVFNDLKDEMNQEAKEIELKIEDIYPDDYQFILDNIEELALLNTGLTDTITKIRSYGINDIPSWIETGITDEHRSYLSSGYFYSGRYCE